MTAKKRARSLEDKQKQLDRILTQGEQLIRESGVQGFSIRALAKHLNMSPGNLYNYFTGEHELRAAIIERHMSVSKEYLENTIQKYEGSYIELLKTTLRHYLESAYTEENWFHLLILSQANEHTGIDLLHIQKGMLDPLKKIIKKAIEAEELEPTLEPYLLPYYYILILGTSAAFRSSSFPEILARKEKNKFLDFLIEYQFKTCHARSFS